MQKINKHGVGFVINHWRSNSDFERVAVFASDRGGACVGLDVQGKGKPALRRVVAIPVHRKPGL